MIKDFNDIECITINKKTYEKFDPAKDIPAYIVTNSNISEEELKTLKTHKLPIFFKDVPEAYYDELGGFHDSGIGWNPNGNWCGECTVFSCKNCPNFVMN